MANKQVRSGATKPGARKVPTAAKRPEAKTAATPSTSPAKPEAPKVPMAAAKPAPAAAPAAKPTPVATKVEAPVAAKPVAQAVNAAVDAAKSEAAAIAVDAPEIIEKPVEVAKVGATTISKSVEKEANTMATTVENTMNKTQALFGDVNERGKAAMEKSAKMVEEMNDFAKGNIEAMVESSRIAAKGMESIGQEAAEYTRKSFEQATATMKSLASVKSPTELFKLQSDYMRSAFDMYVAEASKTTEHMMKLAGDAAQPLSNRMAVAADKVKTAA